MLLTIFFLLTFNSAFQSFPTFHQGDPVSIYKTISKYQQSFSVDFLDKTDDLVTLKNSLSLLLSPENDEIYIKPLFSLLKWIKNYFVKIKMLQTKPAYVYESESNVQIKIFETLKNFITDFSGIRNKRQGATNIIISIGKDNEYIKMTEVPGCSPELYGRNKIACLKKFLNLVKTPISKYIGTDLLNPLINILNRPISIATTSNIQEIGQIFNFRLQGPTYREELLNKLIGIKEHIPTNEYNNLKKNINEQSVDTFPNTESEDSGVSLLQILTEVSQNEADIRKLQNQVSDTDFSEQKQKLSQLENRLSELTNRLDTVKQADLNLKILSEISENEGDIQVIKEHLSNTGNLNDQKEKLQQVEANLLELTNKIESQLQTVLNTRPNYDAKLSELSLKLNELKLSDKTTDNSVVNLKIEELEKSIFNILNSNVQKSDEHNSDLLTLKNSIAEIKYSLSKNIQQLNEDKTHLLSIVSPLRNLQSEIDSLKIKIETMNQGSSITKINSEQKIPLSNEQDLLDLLNNAIFDCRNIKTLLSNSKSSIFLPSILDDKHIRSLSISALQPNSFFLQWDYYDDLLYENLIIPLPICDENRCYYFSKNGFGNETGFYDSGRCTYIVENEYYCNFKKEKMSCAEYERDCEIVKSTMIFHDPLVLNDTHTLLFTRNPTIIKNDLFIEKLDLLTNYIVSFNLNTTFFVNNMEYDADGFDQKEQIKLTKLMMMEKHFWTLNMYNIIAGIAIFILASLIILFTTILAVKKCKKQNENTAIRINRSRIYYSASRQQTSSL
jgi:hypothetical protein